MEFDIFPDDTILEILEYMDVFSIVGIRCVSKLVLSRWGTIIETSNKLWKDLYLRTFCPGHTLPPTTLNWISRFKETWSFVHHCDAITLKEHIITTDDKTTNWSRSGAASCKYNNFVYLFGGATHHYNMCDSVLQLDLETDKITKVLDLPFRGWGMSVCSTGETAYLYFKYAQHMCKLDLTTRHLEKIIAKGDFPINLVEQTGCMYKGSIFLFGGSSRGSTTSDVYVFDTESKIWSRPFITGKPPRPRCWHSAVCIDEKMYIFGGWENKLTKSFFNDLSILDLNSLNWESVICGGELPPKRCQTCLFRWSHYLVVLGGSFQHEIPLGDAYGDIVADCDDIWLFDTQTNVWLKAKTHFTHDCGVGTVVPLEGSVGIFGGMNSEAKSNSPSFHDHFITLQFNIP